MSNVDLIREWIESDRSSSFPPTIDDYMTERFLYVCNNDIIRTKEVIKLFFKFRTETTEFFTNRDPLAKSQQLFFDVVCVYPLPKKTVEGYQVYLTHFLDFNPDKFDFVEYAKMFFNASDVRMKTEEKIPTGDIPIFDMNGFTLKHFMKLMFAMNSVKKYLRITQEAHPVRLKQIHVINTSPLLEKILTMIKPLLRDEIKSMIHFHAVGSNGIFQYIPHDIIPVEIGGKGASIYETKDYWKKQIENNSEWLRTNPWRNNSSDENKNFRTNVEEQRGTFKTLALD